MTRVSNVNLRYAASATLTRRGIEIVSVGDPVGAQFNAAIRRLLALSRESDGNYLDDLLGISQKLSWQRITHPQPPRFNPALHESATEVATQAKRMRGAISDQVLLDELADKAMVLASTESPVGPVLLESILEIGSDLSVIIAASKCAASGLENWLEKYSVLVLTAGELSRNNPDREQSYVIGPPLIYQSSLVTAPVTNDVSFLMPEWFQNHTVPHSVISPYAEGAIRIKGRAFTVGEISESDYNFDSNEEISLPQPNWGTHQSDNREPTSEEVSARKILLSGNLAMWLDDGDRIRSLDPHQPQGERVTYTDVEAVRQGIYLLLRQGTTERGAHSQAALRSLAADADAIETTQAAWKLALAKRLQQHGYRHTVDLLRATGVKSAERVRAWTDPNLIRPNSDHDFYTLIQWLRIPSQPTFNHATTLRNTLYKVSAEIRKQLELAVADADLLELEEFGHLRLDIDNDGFRGIIATRVLAISPFTKIVSRQDARVPFEDLSAQWLE